LIAADVRRDHQKHSRIKKYSSVQEFHSANASLAVRGGARKPNTQALRGKFSAALRAGGGFK